MCLFFPDIRIILDFIPNYTSMNHTWFEHSRTGGADNVYKDYYVWHAGNGGQPPNNWVRMVKNCEINIE